MKLFGKSKELAQQVEKLQAELATIKAQDFIVKNQELIASLTEISNKNQELATLNASLDSTKKELQAKIESMASELATAKAAVLDFEQKVTKASIDLVAGQGVPTIKIDNDNLNYENPLITKHKSGAMIKKIK